MCRRAAGPDGALRPGFVAGRGKPKPVGGDAEVVDVDRRDEIGEEPSGEEEDGAEPAASSESDSGASESDDGDNGERILRGQLNWSRLRSSFAQYGIAQPPSYGDMGIDSTPFLELAVLELRLE